MVTATDNPASASIQSFASDFHGVDLPVFDDSHNNEPSSPNDIALGKNFYKPECVLLVKPFPSIFDVRFDNFSIRFHFETLQSYVQPDIIGRELQCLLEI